MENELSLAIEQKESIKLMKMSKGYQWEIKIIIVDKSDDETLKRLKLINDKLAKEYGETL
jgi:hypothetical protein